MAERQEGSTSANPDVPIAAYLLSFVVIGIALASFGPALSHLRDRLHTNDGGIAFVLAGQGVGYIGGSLLAGRGLDRGRGHLWWSVALAVATISLALAGSMPNLASMTVLFVLTGAACGVCDVAGNTLVMWSRPRGAGALLNALHLCFALGALASPLLVNRSLHYTDSLWGVAIPMAAMTAIIVWSLMRRPAPVRTRLDTVARSDASGGRNLHVLVICLFFFAYVALEAGFAGWIHTYTEQIHYGGAATATGMITTFWVGFALGRLVAIWVAGRVSPGWMVGVSVCMCVMASTMLVVFRDAGPMLWVVTFVFALSVAPQYASMMAFAESHLALSGGNIAAIIGASGLGGLLLPWAIGQLFDAVGPKALPYTTLAVSAATAVIAGAAGAMLVNAHRPPLT
ncbi:MAG: MFS transporter [Actinomycetota bacterium]